MISKDSLMQILIKGRFESYIRKNSDFNPYVKSVLYDWEFKTEVNGFAYTDSYRGYNPYSGVEYVYEDGNYMPIWSCDYIGYVLPDTAVSANKVYEFLKEARSAHLLNCSGNLFSNYQHGNDTMQYKTHFHGDKNALLQVENFFYDDKLIAQQMSSGRLKV